MLPLMLMLSLLPRCFAAATDDYAGLPRLRFELLMLMR